MNYWASGIGRDEMPEPVVINLDSDDDDSSTDTASENEELICLFAMKLLNKYKNKQIRNERIKNTEKIKTIK